MTGILGSKMKCTLKSSSPKLLLALVLEVWYVALPGGPSPNFCSDQGSRVKDAPTRGFYVQTIEIQKKMLKIFILRTTCLRCLKFGMWPCLVVLYQVCSNKGPRYQDGPVPEGPRFEP